MFSICFYADTTLYEIKFHIELATNTVINHHNYTLIEKNPETALIVFYIDVDAEPFKRKV